MKKKAAIITSCILILIVWGMTVFADTSDDFILPFSGTRELAASDIEDLTLQEMCYARNEIFARYGRRFNSRELTDYFNTKSWYHGTEDPASFDERSKGILNDYERKNAQFLLDAERGENHPNGYVLDWDGYDIYLVRSYSERNPGSVQSSGTSENQKTGTEDSPTGSGPAVKTAELYMYGLYQKNQGIIPTNYNKYAMVLQSPFAYLDHNGQYSFSHQFVNQKWGAWLFDFDQDGETELLAWDIDDWYLYHWKLFDKRDGTVYQIAEDCGDQPGNAGHGLQILRDGTIHATSSKGMVNYIANWDSYIFFEEGDIHYLYGYSYLSAVEEGYEGEFVLTEEAYALDGERIDEDLFNSMKASFEAREVPYPITEQPYTYDYKSYYTRLEIAGMEGWDPAVDGTLDGQ